MISILDLDKAEVFAALYNGARAQGMRFLRYTPEPMTAEQARTRFGDNFGYFDYVDGRVMKVQLADDVFNPSLYNRDNGQGAAESVINTLRASKDVNADEIQALHKQGVKQAAYTGRDNAAIEPSTYGVDDFEVLHMTLKDSGIDFDSIIRNLENTDNAND